MQPCYVIKPARKCDKQQIVFSHAHIARREPLGETAKADITSRVILLDPILVHEVVFQDIIFP
jgi:hypothetical protein